MNKIILPETNTSNDAWKVFQNANEGQAFLLRSNSFDIPIVVIKTRPDNQHILITDILSGNRVFDLKKMNEWHFEETQVKLTPVDLEIKVVMP